MRVMRYRDQEMQRKRRNRRKEELKMWMKKAIKKPNTIIEEIKCPKTKSKGNPKLARMGK